MKTRMTTAALLAALWGTGAGTATAGTLGIDSDNAWIRSAGPRLGVLYLSDAETRRALKERHAGKMLTVFGWQAEHEYFKADGVAGLVEVIPAIAGMEAGMFLPSLTAMLGVRIGGFEIGVGPSAGTGVTSKVVDSPTGPVTKTSAAVGIGMA
ncbi:MAG: hypothetical protein AAB368_17625, partial [bacterium]